MEPAHRFRSDAATKAETSDRQIAEASGDAPCAPGGLAQSRPAKGRGLWLCLCGSVGLGTGVGRIVCNLHEQIESVKYREFFWGLVLALCGVALIGIACKLDKRRVK